MPEQTTHPSPAELNAYGLGQLPPDEAAVVENHIEACEPCCETIADLTAEDTFMDLLQRARRAPMEQTVDHAEADTSSSCPGIPIQLAEHPRYEILTLIGKGGMGDVYKAKHRMMKRTVALKIINRDFIRKAEAVDRFHREVETAAKVSHPNVVTAHDAEQANDLHFLVMEYVDGVNLSQTVRQRGPLPIDEACDYIRQAALGLEAAHERGMVHRDIKPHNLMLTAEGTVKILDFGLASLTTQAAPEADGTGARSDLTTLGAIMGTPDFISPEQAEDARGADIRSDIYSLGATLYFLLTGQPPFANGDVVEKLKCLAESEPERLESLRSDIPAELGNIVMKMLAKDPDERFQSPAEVAAALESFATGADSSAPAGHAQMKDLSQHDASAASADENGVMLGKAGNGSGNVLIIGDDNNDDHRGVQVWLWIGWGLVATAFLCLGLTIASMTTAYNMTALSGSSATGLAQGVSGSLKYMIVGLPASLAGIIVLVVTHLRRWRLRSGRQPLQPAKHRPPTPGPTYRFLALTAVAILFVSALFAGLIYLQTDHGVVRIEVTDPSLEVSIKDHTITVKDGEGKALTIRPGEQSLIVRKDDSDLEFETDRFQIRRGDMIAFKVELRAGKVMVSKDGKKFAAKTTSNRGDNTGDNTGDNAGDNTGDNSGDNKTPSVARGSAPDSPADDDDRSQGEAGVEISPEASAALAKASLSKQEAAKPQEPAERELSAKQKTTAFLIEAAKRGDLTAVEAALQAGVDPNGPANRLTALHWAVTPRISDGKTIEPSPEIAERLIDAGANVNAKDYLGQTPLEWAVKHASLKTVEMLIKAGADVNAESRYGTVLKAGKRPEIAKLLIEAGADIHAGEALTPLSDAAKRGNLKLIELLLDKGANIKDPANPPIHWATTPEVAKALIKAGADVNQRNSKGETALHRPHGYWFGPDAETVKVLIEAGADVKAVSNLGLTPLHAAVRDIKPEVAKVLIAAGPELDVPDKQGNTPLAIAQQNLSWASRSQRVDKTPYAAVLNVLVDAGAKDDGRTELLQAVAAGDLEKVKQLIEAEVDVNETGPQRITAAHLASEEGQAEILEALIEAGADVDRVDANRMRPLHLAANVETARLLIAEGAKVNLGTPSPLYAATAAGRADVVRELIRNKANVSDSDCTSMLNWAAFFGRVGVVKVLLEDRDAKELVNAPGVYSPLHVAASGSLGDMGSPRDVTPEQRLGIAKLLVGKGADVNLPWGAKVNPRSGAAPLIGTTPLMFAAGKGEPEMAKFLLEKGADAKAANSSGRTALHFAAERAHRPVVEELLETKADVNALTRDGKTPLDLAQDAAVKVLLIQSGGKTASELLQDAQR